MRETLARIAQGVGLLVICAAVAWAANGVTGVGGGSNVKAGFGDGGFPDPTAVHQNATAERKLGVLTVGSLVSGDGGFTVLGGALTVEQISRPSGALPITGSPVAIDGGMTVNGQLSNSRAGIAGSGYTDLAMCAGASIIQSQAATGNFVMSLCANDSSNNWVGFAPSGGGTASGSVYFRSGSSNGQLYIGPSGYRFDSGGSAALTLSTTLAAFPAAVTIGTTLAVTGKLANSANGGTCTLDGATPSKCTITVTAGAVCTCSPVGASAAIAAAGCAVSLSSTTLTLTSGATLTNNVNAHCDR